MHTPIERKLQQARQRLQNGDFMGAAFLCEEVLRRAPGHPGACWLLGTAHLMSGDAAQARPLLERAVSAAPDNGAAADSLGLSLLVLGEFAQAEQVLRMASAMPGAPAIVHMRLGVALLHQAQYVEAIAHLLRATELEPRNIDMRLNLGQAYGRAGNKAAAQAVLEGVVAEAPRHPDALYNLGVLHLEADELDVARTWFERTLTVSPQHVEALVNLGVTLHKQGRLDEAAATLRAALSQASPPPAAASQLGIVLAKLGEREQACGHFLRALRLDPNFPEAHEGLAALYLAVGRYQEAVAELRALLQLEPSNAAASSSLAAALLQLGAIDEAEQAALTARRLAPDGAGAYSVLAQLALARGALDEAVAMLEEGLAASQADSLLGMLVYLLGRTCDWTKWRVAGERMSAALERGALVGSPFYLLHEDTTPESQLAYARRWAEARFTATAEPPITPPRKRPRLRIGYLSSDFQQHAVGYLIVEALECHDRERVEVFAYSYGPDDRSAMRSRLSAAVEHFVDIAWEPEDKAVERIRRDDLDVLVDLKGYTLGDRLSIMAARPCATQVTWLGYPGTTGASFVDYLIADPFLVPPTAEPAYSEKVLRLPHCYQPNDRQRPIAPTLERRDYGLPEDAVVFCCFNQSVKIRPEVFSRWMSLLRRVPDSVLWLLEDNQWATANLVGAAAAAGIPAERLVFAPRAIHSEHLARYRAADLALDTFPYTSHTTASDAVWLGCPLVALCGETFAARVSGSILTACGLPDLVTYTLDEYETLVYRLATSPAALDELRGRVASARATAPLFDSTRFARDLERIYAQIAK